MKFYKTEKKNAEGEVVDAKWSGSQADASKERAAFTKAGAKRAEVDTIEADVPTDKVGLLGWLNKHVI